MNSRLQSDTSPRQKNILEMKKVKNYLSDKKKNYLKIKIPEMIIKTFSMKIIIPKNIKKPIKNKRLKLIVKIPLNKFIMLQEILMIRQKRKSKDPR